MNLDLLNRVALVTGSSRGIGNTIAETLHAEGCRVALSGRNATDLSAAVLRLAGTKGFVADVTNPSEVGKLVENVVGEFGSLDVLVCNVGSGQSVSPGSESLEEWQRVFALNFWSATNTIEAAKNALIASKGTIVCISSICGVEVIPGAPLTYSAAKASLNAYVRGIARPLGKFGVRINAVAPGNIMFDGSVWDKKQIDDLRAVDEMLRREVSLSRLGTTTDVAQLVAYLASPKSAFATGQIWTLDGGQTRS
jgi:3-oxoacyl-[acyl-carrier protein] reductase